MDQPPTEAALPPGLRFLKWLVILLTLSMIGGVITVVALLVTRMPALTAAVPPALPPALALPAGLRAEAVTMGRGFVAVVARGADGGERILVFTPEGRLRQEVAVAP